MATGLPLGICFLDVINRVLGRKSLIGISETDLFIKKICESFAPLLFCKR